jgi:hypothetical protein
LTRSIQLVSGWYLALVWLVCWYLVAVRRWSGWCIFFLKKSKNICVCGKFAIPLQPETDA